MINDKKLGRMSLSIAIAGMISIYAVSLLAGPEKTEISSITEEDAGKQVVVNGTVASKSTSDGHFFIELDDGRRSIKAVMFERTARNDPVIHSVEEGSIISATGQVNVYKGELEIILISVK